MSESIGAALRAGREQRRMTLAQVSEATRVRIHYLQALENDDLSSMPSAAQGRGFLRIYAQFLDLDADALISAALAKPEAVSPQTPATPSPVAKPVSPSAVSMPAPDSPPPFSLAASPEASHGPRLTDRLAQLRERVLARLAAMIASARKPDATTVTDSDSEAKKKAST